MATRLCPKNPLLHAISHTEHEFKKQMGLGTNVMNQTSPLGDKDYKVSTTLHTVYTNFQAWRPPYHQNTRVETITGTELSLFRFGFLLLFFSSIYSIKNMNLKYI